MVTLQNICDVVFEDLQPRVSCNIVKYKLDGQPIIEITPSPERIILIDFNPDEVEVYDSSASAFFQEVHTLEPGDPAFLDKLYVALTKLGVNLS